jgi:hypothetical protein
MCGVNCYLLLVYSCFKMNIHVFHWSSLWRFNSYHQWSHWYTRIHENTIHRGYYL